MVLDLGNLHFFLYKTCKFWYNLKKMEEFMKYIRNLVEDFQIPLDNIFDPEYPDWGADDRGVTLYETIENTNLISTYGFNNEYDNFEVYIESSDSVEDLAQCWQKNLLYEVCRTIPEIEDFAQVIEEVKYFVIQLHMEGAPDEWSLDHENGNIGIFIGMENKEYLSDDYKIINIKLMRPQELKLAIQKGSKGKEELAKLYYKEKIPTDSSMSRKSVI